MQEEIKKRVYVIDYETYGGISDLIHETDPTLEIQDRVRYEQISKSILEASMSIATIRGITIPEEELIGKTILTSIRLNKGSPQWPDYRLQHVWCKVESITSDRYITDEYSISKEGYVLVIDDKTVACDIYD